jgi:hypothetical protein
MSEFWKEFKESDPTRKPPTQLGCGGLALCFIFLGLGIVIVAFIFVHLGIEPPREVGPLPWMVK